MGNDSRRRRRQTRPGIRRGICAHCGCELPRPQRESSADGDLRRGGARSDSSWRGMLSEVRFPPWHPDVCPTAYRDPFLHFPCSAVAKKVRTTKAAIPAGLLPPAVLPEPEQIPRLVNLQAARTRPAAKLGPPARTARAAWPALRTPPEEAGARRGRAEERRPEAAAPVLHRTEARKMAAAGARERPRALGRAPAADRRAANARESSSTAF
jgi:hypothetical protein